MAKLRTTLMLGVVVVGVVGVGASLFVVQREAPGALRSLIAVQLGMLVALAVSVYALLGPTVNRVDELVEAMRALARGDKHTRVQASDFAGLRDLATAANEVGASMCENEDPNLGPVQRTIRERPVKRAGSDGPRPSQGSGPARRAPTTLAELADTPVVGEARPSRRPTAKGDDDVKTGDESVVADGIVADRRPSKAAPTNQAVLPEPAAPDSTAPKGPSPSTGETDSDDDGDLGEISGPLETMPPIVDSEGVSEPRPRRKSRKARKAERLAAQKNESSLPTAAKEEAGKASAAPDADGKNDQAAATTTEPSTAQDDDQANPPAEKPEAASDGDEVVNDVNDVDATDTADATDTTDGTDSSTSAVPETSPDAGDDAPADDDTSNDGSGDATNDAGNDTVIEAAPELPGVDELRALFDEFIREKRAAGQGEGLDVDFDAFAETILSESERLVDEHQCRGVRFEVAVAEGEVSLRPRLIR